MSRKKFVVKNISSTPVSFGDLPKVNTIQPNESSDLLRFYDIEFIGQSRNLLNAIKNSKVIAFNIQDGVKTEVNSDSPENFIAVANVAQVKPKVQTLEIAEDDSVTWDTNKGIVGILNLTDSITFNFPTKMEAGETYILKINMGPNSPSISWDEDIHFPSGTAPTLSTDEGACDIITFVFDGTTIYGVHQSDFGSTN